LRQYVRESLAHFGATAAELDQMSETLLIRDGHYCGRSFRAGDRMAMWLGGLLQFYGPHGQMLRTVSLQALLEQVVHNKAA
jgi:hypothetical protein